jgi:hypothetical protein
MTVVEQTPPAGAAPAAVTEPRFGLTEPGSVVAVVMDFVGATLPQFDQLLGSMRLRPNGPGLTGSLFQWSRQTLDGVRVTEVWQSRQHFEFFLREEIEPLLSGAGLREPEITTYEVHTYLTQGPEAAQPSGDDVFENAQPRAGSTLGRPVLAQTDGQ